MPTKRHIVVILDVNSIPRESQGNDGLDQELGEDQDGGGSATATTITTPGGTNGLINVKKRTTPPNPYKIEMIKSIKEMVLTLLAKEALQYHSDKFDFSQVFWSIKLYNSSIEINSKTGRSFQPVGLDSIEAFEKQLESFLDVSSQSALKSDPSINQIQFLSTSLKSVLGDLPWPEPSGENDQQSGNHNRNVIHAMFRVPASEGEVEQFIPSWTSDAGSKAIMNELLPKAFCRKMKESQIQLHFMDLSPAVKNGNEGGEKCHSWATETLSRPMMKIAHYLGGRISTFNHISGGVPLGMPSYADLLKQILASHSVSDTLLNSSRSKAVLNDTQKTIRKLQGSMNGSLVNKTADDTDGDSVRSNNNGHQRIAIPTPSYALAKHQRRSCPEIPVAQQHNDLRWGDYTLTRPSAAAPFDSEIRRYSDEREHQLQNRRQTTSAPRLPQPIRQHDVITKKRKYEFEYDMESEEGYSPNDIENWRMGKAAMKEKDKQLHNNNNTMYRAAAAFVPGRDRSSNFGQKHQQAKHQRPVSRYLSPQITQPQKRIRRSDQTHMDEAMAPPFRHPHHRHSNNAVPATATSSNKFRHSDPVTASVARKSNRTESQTLNYARGRVMVHEGLKKKNNPNTKHNQQKLVRADEVAKAPLCNFWNENEQIMNSYKQRFQSMTKSSRKGKEDDPIDDLAVRAKWFTEAVIREGDCCLPSAAQALVTTVGAFLFELKVRDLRASMEKILFIPYDSLNLEVIRLKNSDDDDEETGFRKCFLQIFINFEMWWAMPVKNMAALEEQFIENVTRILHLVRVYRKKPPIEDFVNDMLIPLYNLTHGRLLREIADTMNIRPAAMLNTSFDSPRSGSGSGRDDCSVSSFSSSMCGPEDSTSQHPNDNSFSQNSQQLNQSQNSVRTSLRTASFLSLNNPKRVLMLPVSKFPTKPKIYQRSQSQSTQSGPLRPFAKSPKPKKVRRNLFDVQASRDPKDMKTLLNLATSNTSSFSRSPSLFKSPMSNKLSCSPRSPGRPSPFFAAARARAAKGKGRSSRRRLIMDPEDDVSPDQRPVSGAWGTMTSSPNESLLCPESPITPHFKTCNKETPGSKHSSGKSIVHESPESVKPKPNLNTGNNRSGGLYRNFTTHSVSFYSSGNESLKARAWERSGAKLMAARIRDSVDLSQSLTLNDLDFKDSDSNEQEEKEELDETGHASPIACCSTAIKSQREEVTSKDGIQSSSSIRALISEEIMPTPAEILNAIGTTITTVPPPSYKSPALDTPSKRVQFSIELVQTPSPSTPVRSHGGTPVTPKSILKDAGNTHT